MTDKPWLTDQKYGGMSEVAAQRSYEAWIRQGRKPLPKPLPEPISARELDRQRLIIDDLYRDYERTSLSYVAWMKDWWARRPRGFRALRGRLERFDPETGELRGLE